MTFPPEAGAPPSSERHLTATGFLVWHGRVLLHWHRKNSLWLPFGGHLEANEDPVQCVLREVEEESGVAAVLFGTPRPLPFDYPTQLAPPITILLEQVSDGLHRHEHIDLIYFCRPLAEPPQRLPDTTMRWLARAELERNEPYSPEAGAPAASLPEDVRVLALAALALAEAD